MSGGDRKLYIFELIDNYGLRNGVYISLYDIRTLADMCLNINTALSEKERDILEPEDSRIFVNKDKFDIVGANNIIEIASLCRESKLHINNVEATFIFAVYKPNGLYYIGLKIAYGKSHRFIPLMQIGELEVALGFIEESNKSGTGSEAMKYLSLAAAGVVSEQYGKSIGRVYYNRVESEYLGLLKSREMCIDGISDIKQYNSIGIPEILKRCLGYTDNISELYTKPSLKDEVDNIPESSLEGLIDDTDIAAMNVMRQIADSDFDFSDEDFGDI